MMKNGAEMEPKLETTSDNVEEVFAIALPNYDTPKWPTPDPLPIIVGGLVVSFNVQTIKQPRH